ncbi:L-asparaginase-like [Latimeria chalumnae]|uniref:L-asparaginase-like n=1 Tax=Latimeria chalumnae TaxID=7897 RepID=UPI00313F2F4A
MHVAAMLGNLDMVKFLLSRGAAHTVQDRFASTPLYDAIKFRHFKIIKLLRAKGVKLTLPPVKVGVEICSTVSVKDYDSLRAWYLAGAYLDQGDYMNRTPMHVAVYNDDIKSVEILLRNGATPLEKDNWGFTAVDEARHLKLSKILEVFHPKFTEQIITKEELLQRRRRIEIMADDYL